MAVIGTITCSPSAKFAFPRSYVEMVGLRAGYATAIWSGRSVDLIEPISGAIYWRTVFNERFWDWSSNRYTLDFAVEECYYFEAGTGNHIPLNIFVWWSQHPVTLATMIETSPFTGQPYSYPQSLPSSPGGYWFPPNG